MNAESARAVLVALPHVVETMQWGESLVFWVGDKAIGGKMFTLISLDAANGSVVWFAAGGERTAELCEQEGFFPAPYLARAGWVAVERWNVLRAREWEEAFCAAHTRILEKLPARTRAVLAMSERDREKLILERRQMLLSRAARKPAKRRRS